MSQQSLLRYALLFGVALNLCLIVVRVSFYRPLLAMPGALHFVVEPVIGLAGYGLFAVAATSGENARRQKALYPGAAWGLVGGALLVAHLFLESFGRHRGENSWITLAFMFTTFVLWGVAGFVASRNTASTSLGLLGGCLSAVVSVLVAVSFGFGLMFFEAPSLDYVGTWPEFKQSGWHDV